MTFSHKADPVSVLAGYRNNEVELPSTVVFGDTTVSLAERADTDGVVPRIRLNIMGDMPFSSAELMQLAGTISVSLVVNEDSQGLYVTSMNRRCSEFDLRVFAKRFLQKLNTAGQHLVSTRSGSKRPKRIQPKQDPHAFHAHMQERRARIAARRNGQAPDAS